ncbi:hypothetical protein HK100_010862, partial [Physocladia obscura]
MEAYLMRRSEVSRSLRTVAASVQAATRRAGAGRTVGGGAGLVSGAAAVGGVVLAPFTAGASLLLTASGVASGVAAAAATAAAAAYKSRALAADARTAGRLAAGLAQWERQVAGLLARLDAALSGFDAALALPGAPSWLDRQSPWLAYAAGSYRVAATANQLRFLRSLAVFLRSDVAILQHGVALSAAAPGLSLFGRSLLAAGGSAAKLLTSSVAVVGLVSSAVDFADGVKDLSSSSQLAVQYQAAADDIDRQSKIIADLITLFIQNPPAATMLLPMPAATSNKPL